jgi:hypothetical protein
VVVDNFDLPGISIPPFKADTPLVINANAPLPLPIATELLEAVPRRLGKLFDTVHALDLPEFAKGDSFNRGKTARMEPLEQPLGFLVTE